MNTTAGNSTNSTLGSTWVWDGDYWFNFTSYLSYRIPILVSTYMNLFLGLPPNGYVLWLIMNGVGGTIQSEFFALNLTVSEIVYCVSNIMYLIWEYQNKVMLLPIVLFFSTFIYMSRPLFQTCICLERYLAVVHPVVFLRYKALSYRLVCCSVVWLLVTSISFYVAFTDKQLFSNLYFVGVYLIVLSLVQLFFCLSVLRVLRQSGPGEGGREGGVSSNIKRRAFKIILLNLITMLITYFPLVITIGLLLCSNVSLHNGTFYFGFYISVSIVIMCGLVQPLLFLQRTGKLPCLNMAP